VVVNEITNRLDTRPPGRRIAKGSPREIEKFGIHFAVAARQQKLDRFDREFLDTVLQRVGHGNIERTGITNNRAID
jgi:hypothetical protein